MLTVELPGVYPSAVHETREERQKDCTNHGDESRKDSSPIAAKRC